jgi:hypothetical protein
LLGLSKIAKILFFREPEVLETGMIMPHEKEKTLVYACIQKKVVYLQSSIGNACTTVYNKAPVGVLI